MTKFRFRGESQLLDAAVRATAPDKFVTLSDGMVHYEWDGPPDGPPVILVHGFSVPYYIWDPTFPALVEAGFRVLRYDLYGRGYSDRPDVVYDENLYERQLGHLLSALGMDGPVNLVGLSMGGPIVLTFIDRQPQRVGKFCLIDPAGFPMAVSFGMKLVQIPVLGEWLMSLLGDRILLSGLSADFYQLEDFSSYLAQFRAQMQYEGFKRALLSTMRSGILNNMAETYRRVGEQERPSLLIWGREDHLVPFAVSEKVRQAIPYIEFHAIDGAGHIPHYERPYLVNSLLIAFLGN